MFLEPAAGREPRDEFDARLRALEQRLAATRCQRKRLEMQRRLVRCKECTDRLQEIGRLMMEHSTPTALCIDRSVIAAQESLMALQQCQAGLSRDEEQGGGIDADVNAPRGSPPALR